LLWLAYVLLDFLCNAAAYQAAQCHHVCFPDIAYVLYSCVVQRARSYAPYSFKLQQRKEFFFDSVVQPVSCFSYFCKKMLVPCERCKLFCRIKQPVCCVQFDVEFSRRGVVFLKQLLFC